MDIESSPGILCSAEPLKCKLRHYELGLRLQAPNIRPHGPSEAAGGRQCPRNCPPKSIGCRLRLPIAFGPRRYIGGAWLTAM